MPAASGKDLDLSIPTAQAWTDTGIELQPGDVLQITAEPVSAAAQTVPDRHTLNHPATVCDSAGAGSPAAGSAPLNSAPAGALIGKLHSQGAMPFLVGQSKELKIEEQGHLYLGANNEGSPACQGSYAVKVHLASAAGTVTSGQSASSGSNSLAGNGQTASTGQTAANQNVKSKLAAAAQTWLGGQFGTGASTGASANASNSAVASGPNSGSNSGGSNASISPKDLTVSNAPLDAKLREAIDHLPRRVNDKFNNLGDMVNFVMIGSEKDVQAALDAANWHVADRSTSTAIAKAVLMATEKQDYLQMPMSQLYLFGRIQDFGYEQAEPYAVVASRHHFRIWKAPFEFNGQQVWVGAGTHDIGFEKDQRNGNVTHKIDPAVDGERENIASSLQKSGKTKSVMYYLPPNPVQDARNATGGGYHSDGRIVVIEVK